MPKKELIEKVQKTFLNEQEHKDTLTFMLSSDIGSWIQMQSEEVIQELAILLKKYHVYKHR